MNPLSLNTPLGKATILYIFKLEGDKIPDWNLRDEI